MSLILLTLFFICLIMAAHFDKKEIRHKKLSVYLIVGFFSLLCVLTPIVMLNDEFTIGCSSFKREPQNMDSSEPTRQISSNRIIHTNDQ